MKLLGKLYSGILKHTILIIILFSATALVSVALIFGVSVNYSMEDYLPDDSSTSQALDVMQREYGLSVPNLRVYVPGVSITQALEYKREIAAVPGVSEVMWLDDAADLTTPAEFLDEDITGQFYVGGGALFSVTVEASHEKDAVEGLRQLIGDEGAMTGNALDLATAQQMTESEITRIILILIPVILLILFLSSSSYVEPLLYIITIGAAVLLNMGTNIFFGEVSFITNSVSPILQLAVSLDYSVFLLNSFAKCRTLTPDPKEAMRMAVMRSFPSITASSMTTLFGFIALVFMRFGIGSDLGLNLTKGILFSLVTTMFFLPALTLSMYKLIDKTQHKTVNLTFARFSRAVTSLRVPALIFVLLILAPSFLAQKNNTFTYGMGELDPQSEQGQDASLIDGIFGQSMPVVLLVPRGEPGTETVLCERLEQIPNVTSVLSYASVAAAVPSEYLTQEITKNFYSENYSRVILYTSTAPEGEDAFSLVQSVTNTAREYYPDALVCGQSAAMYDIMQTVSADSLKVNLIAIISIALIIGLTFRSVSLPVLLVLAIEISIWLNLSVPYFMQSSISYIGYLIINTVQLGATVDYAILYTDNYMKNRTLHPPREASRQALSHSLPSILVSASILAAAGFLLSIISSNEIVSQLGLLLGRGTVLSALTVAVFLPGTLILCDGLIKKTTYKPRFTSDRDKKIK